MGILRRNRDFIDFTELQKRGLIKKSKENLPNNMKVNSDGTIEFIAPQESTTNVVGNTSNSIANVSSPFGFLDSFASAATNTQGEGKENNLSNLVNQSPCDLNQVKLKLDDFDFKLGKLMERIEKMESKLLDFESRV